MDIVIQVRYCLTPKSYYKDFYGIDQTHYFRLGDLDDLALGEKISGQSTGQHRRR